MALVSGGKDSCYAMMKCIHYGHQVSFFLFFFWATFLLASLWFCVLFVTVVRFGDGADCCFGELDAC